MCTEYSEAEKKLIGKPWVIYKGTEEKFTEGPHSVCFRTVILTSRLQW